MRLALRRAVAVSSLCVLAGCGTGAGGDVATEPAPDGGAGPDGQTRLTVVVTAAPQRAERTYTLVCDPPGGDHPDATGACRALARMKDPFAPVPSGAMCTEIYGGPQTATVTGTLRGEPVDARFSRTDGCQISRWDRHAAVLVEPGGVGSR
jgi:hypothetical protein